MADETDILEPCSLELCFQHCDATSETIDQYQVCIATCKP